MLPFIPHQCCENYLPGTQVDLNWRDTWYKTWYTRHYKYYDVINGSLALSIKKKHGEIQRAKMNKMAYVGLNQENQMVD